jgi:hypothetical protein
MTDWEGEKRVCERVVDLDPVFGERHSQGEESKTKGQKSVSRKHPKVTHKSHPKSMHSRSINRMNHALLRVMR